MIRLLPLLVLASVVVGCSGDDDAGSDSTATLVDATSTPAVSTVPEPTPPTATTSPATTTSATPSTTSASPSTTPINEPIDPSLAPGSGGTATGALDDADVQIETEDGTIQIGVADVPDGVSGDFPIPADLDVQLSSSTDTAFGFSGVSTVSIGELAEFYETGLTDAGYAITDRQEVDGVLAVFSFERGEERGQVAISSAPGGAGSSVLVTIGDGATRAENSADG